MRGWFVKFVFLFLLFGWVMEGFAGVALYPARTGGFTQSLNGDWSFQYIAGTEAGADADFYKPGFEVSSWKTIRVPGNWELQGFAEPRYALELEDGLGLYRRTFRVPEAWSDDRRVILRFEGVAYGFEAWVNGAKVGVSSASAYNPHAFDITDSLKADADNVLAVRVTTRPRGYEFDVNDDWALSGIFRDVTLFSVPTTHVQDLTTRTRLVEGGAAEFSVSAQLSRTEGELRGKLFAPDGGLVSEFDLPRQGRRADAVVRVAKPQLWTAENPALYRLRVSLSAKGQTLHTFEEQIGLREISIVDGVLRLNGRPIKLRGVNHHDIGPETGRAITEQEMRRDLELMKKGNINFVRTSHYPPTPRFIELCDELGLYVMCEVSISSKGREHLDDPAYRENILARVEPTITRDKNRPSVVVWSIGNENPVSDVEMEAGRLAKELDPTRPICLPKIGSYFAENYERIPEHVDIYAPHYPNNARLRDFARKLKRPVILTEYAHALGLGTERLHDQWEILQATPTFAGGSVWMFQDQGILRKAETPPDRLAWTDRVWVDEHRYFDTLGNFGADGIVYSDRTPQTDYWEMRKVYSPVQIAESDAPVKPGQQEIALTVENRHDFRALTGMKLAWSLRRNGADVQRGEMPLNAAAREKETVRVAADIPANAAGDVLTLEVCCLDEKGSHVTERSVRLDLPDAKRDAWLRGLAGTDKSKITESDTEVKVEHPRWTLTVSRPSGALTIHDRAGRVLVAGIYPHPGRKHTLTERIAAAKSNTWRASTLTEVRGIAIKATQEGPAVHLAVSGTYLRPQPPQENKREKISDEPLDKQAAGVVQQFAANESFVGGYQAEITPGGAIAISYDYTPTNARGHFTEAGLSVLLSPELTEFRWIGQGPFAGYPGKYRLNEFGIFHLNREDLRFPGNRRETELAVVTTPAGAGVAMVAIAADVSVERAGPGTLLSHNAVLSGLGNKGASPETFVDVGEAPRIKGSFTLVPLSEAWPEPLVRWFGTPAPARDVFQPFYHSYDQ